MQLPSLLDSGRIVGPGPVSIKQIARRCNLQFPLSLRAFLRAPGCPFSRCIRIHIKVLTNPTVTVDAMLRVMRQIYGTAGIRVEVVSREDLTGIPNFTALNNLDVGTCDGSPTSEQTALFQNRNNVGTGDIVVYFVQTMGASFDGCAIHPTGQDGAAIDQMAVGSVLAHEVGHVLGLRHITPSEDCSKAPGTSGGPSTTRLMSACWLGNLVGIPVIDASEINTMTGSSLVRAC